MRQTRLCTAPVVTLLSSSPALSRRAQAAVQSLFRMESQDGVMQVPDDDRLNSRFQSSILLRKQWDSVVSKCRISGTILHFLSLENSSETVDRESLSVLAIVESGEDECIAAAVAKSRALIAENVKASTVSWRHSLGKSLAATDVLGTRLPLLKLPDSKATSAAQDNGDRHQAPSSGMRLKELCLPHYDDDTYDNGESLISLLSGSQMNRPVVGLYQFQNGLAVRPLPSGKEDRSLSAPSLVFMCKNVEDLELQGATTARIGFSGTSRRGQWMVAHADLPGLDLRLTDSEEFSSSFAEAQDALMASSLSELQSQNVLLEGGGQQRAVSDAMNGVGDCWVEFRANMKKPSGFFKRSSKISMVSKVAKAPSLPYE